jgi:HNH endonuclease
VCLLRDYLTPENHHELLEEASGKTKIQVLEMLARRFPRPDVASKIRKLPSLRTEKAPRRLAHNSGLPSESGAAEQARAASAQAPVDDARVELLSRVLVESSVRRRGEAAVEPLSAARYRIQLNASAQLKLKLERAVDLLSHANPSGDLSIVIERALDVLIERVQAKRFAQTTLPRRGRESELGTSKISTKNRDLRAPERKHVPNAVKRQIAVRDGLRCTFVGSDGQRCTASKFTQIHHEKPWARGGGETVDNLRMLCASHNRLLAERDFGREIVAERIAESGRAAPRAIPDTEKTSPPE